MKKNRILVLGKGFIGNRISKELNCPISGRKIRTFSDAQRLVDRFKPDIIINCIGFTGKNVDECEEQKNTALLANTYIPILLADLAYRNNIKLIHISSGCIFDYNYKKDTPLKESREADFFKLFYSRTKIYAEAVLNTLKNNADILILRIRIPLDSRPHPRNLLNKLIRYRKVIDLLNSVTYLPDFIKALKHLIKIKAKGVYNVVNKGGLRYPDLMNIYSKYVPDFRYKIIPFKSLNIVRTNLLLSTDKLEKSGFKVRNINSVLDQCVKEYLKS